MGKKKTISVINEVQNTISAGYINDYLGEPNHLLLYNLKRLEKRIKKKGKHRYKKLVHRGRRPDGSSRSSGRFYTIPYRDKYTCFYLLVEHL